MPRTSTLVSRRETSRSMRGTIRQRSNAARFSRIVSSVPAPPATYAKPSGDIAFRAAALEPFARDGDAGYVPRAPPT